MSVSATNYSNNLNFRGKYKTSENGTNYYHTNSAMKIGGTLAGITGISSAVNYFQNKGVKDILVDPLKKENKEIFNFLNKNMKLNNKKIICCGLVAIAGHLGCAALIDHVRNKKTKKIAEANEQFGPENTLQIYNQAEISRKNNVYHKSETGSKLGGWLGAGFGIISSGLAALFTHSEIKNIAKNSAEKLTKEEIKLLKKGALLGNLTTAPITIGVGILGGWLLGKWSDKIANKDSYKHV